MNKTILIMGSFVLATVLGITLLWPKYQTIQILNSNIEKREAEIKAKEQHYAQVKEISTKFEEYDDALLKISTALPEDPLPASLFSFLQLSAAESGLVLKKVIWGGIIVPKKKDALKEIKGTIQMTGTYDAFKDFLSAIETSSRIIEIENAFFEPPTKEFKNPFSFILDIKAYSY